MRKTFRAAGRIAAVCLAAALVVLCSGCESAKEEINLSEKVLTHIVVGSDNYPPYNYEDADGKPTGIDVELAKEAFARIGYEPEFRYINWEEKKELVENGNIDCIWGSYSIEGRENLYRWTSPYMKSYQVVAVRKDSDIYTLADLEGKSVAVQSTTKPEEILLSHTDARIPQVKEVFSLQNRELIYTFLSKGYADAIAAHKTAILQCMKDYDLEFRILDEPLLTVGLGVAFAKNDTRGIEKKLSDAFLKMRQDGSIQKIIGKYLEHPEEYLEGIADEK